MVLARETLASENETRIGSVLTIASQDNGIRWLSRLDTFSISDVNLSLVAVHSRARLALLLHWRGHSACRNNASGFVHNCDRNLASLGNTNRSLQ